METIVKGDLKNTGINEIDVPLVISKWSHLWAVYQWDDSYRVIKSLRKDSPIATLKISISRDQAQELIEKLPLIPLPSGFRSGTTWRRMSDVIELETWRLKRYFKKNNR